MELHAPLSIGFNELLVSMIEFIYSLAVCGSVSMKSTMRMHLHCTCKCVNAAVWHVCVYVCECILLC